MIWEVGGEIRRLPASIETPADILQLPWKLDVICPRSKALGA